MPPATSGLMAGEREDDGPSERPKTAADAAALAERMAGEAARLAEREHEAARFTQKIAHIGAAVTRERELPAMVELVAAAHARARRGRDVAGRTPRGRLAGDIVLERRPLRPCCRRSVRLATATTVACESSTIERMQAPLAQMVALTCHANARIRGLPIGSFAQSSTMRFVESVEFMVPRKGGWVCVARDPDEFLGRGPGHGYVNTTRTVRMHMGWSDGGHPRPAESAGMVGGGGVYSTTMVDGSGVYREWRSRWQIGDREAPDQRIWRVTYAMVRIEQSPLPDDAPLDDVRTTLAARFEETRAFASVHRREFAPQLERALRSIEGGEPGYHRDLAPPGALADDALYVLDACQHAWMFGGMGSWNDHSGGPDYDEVTDRLYRAMLAGIVSATNTSALRP